MQTWYNQAGDKNTAKRWKLTGLKNYTRQIWTHKHGISEEMMELGKEKTERLLITNISNDVLKTLISDSKCSMTSKVNKFLKSLFSYTERESVFPKKPEEMFTGSRGKSEYRLQTGNHIDEWQVNRARNVRRRCPVLWGRKAMPWKPSTQEPLLPEQRHAEDILRKASPWVFILYRLCLNGILKDMLQEERKLQHREGLKCEIGFWAKNLAKVSHTQRYRSVQNSPPREGLRKHEGAGLGNNSM